MIVEQGQGQYFLYRHIRLDTNEPFYVGIGSKSEKNKEHKKYKRAYAKSDRNYFWKNITAKTEYEIEILLESNDYDFINQKEIEFIKLYGRRNLGLGTLVNLTDGGDGTTGFILNEEQRKHWSLIRIKSIEQLLKEFKEIHGERYNYDNVVYTQGKYNIDITCFIHGTFQQTPKSHLKGAGCPVCAGQVIGKKSSITKLNKSKSQIVNRFKKIHGDRYDYSLVEYVDIYTPVKIICKEHGIFEQPCNDHLKGCGCSKCRDKQNSENRKKKVIISNGNDYKIFDSIENCAIYFDMCRDTISRYIRTNKLIGDYSLKFYSE